MTAPSAELQSALRAARRDRPSDAAKERMYGQIAAQTAATAAAAPLLSKLLGSLVVKAVALAVSVAVVAGLVAWTVPRVTAQSLGPDPIVDVSATRSDGHVPPASFVVLTAHALPSPGTDLVPAAVNDGDAIEREARWVAEARTALMRGEPALAATKARAARALPSHLLEPEELRILGRALRVMGDDAGADAAFAELVAKYPEEALRP
ncbi:hypothetical protein BH09MYX1_BH09MYX1_32500 [soil metagenome]